MRGGGRITPQDEGRERDFTQEDVRALRLVSAYVADNARDVGSVGDVDGVRTHLNDIADIIADRLRTPTAEHRTCPDCSYCGASTPDGYCPVCAEGGQGSWVKMEPTAEPSEPVGWRPIETAPKDGTKILATGVGLKRWIDVVWWFKGRWRDEGKGWLTGIDHWMPLPAPPAAHPVPEDQP